MAGKTTFTYYLTIDIEAMNEESAMKKLEAWVEPTLALKKNADLNLSAIEYDEPEESEDEETPEEAKPLSLRPHLRKRSDRSSKSLKRMTSTTKTSLIGMT